MHVSARSINTNSCTKPWRNRRITSYLQETTTLHAFWKTTTLWEILHTSQRKVFHQNGHPICFSHVEVDCTIIVYNHLLGEETIWIMPPLRKILISFILNCHFSPPISPTARDIFNLTEWEGMMSSPCILNMKHLESLKNNTRRLQLP